MIVHVAEAEDGMIALVGITTDDLTQVRAGEQPGWVDFRGLFEVGVPLPSFLQIVFVKDEDEFNQFIDELTDDEEEGGASADW